jgi:hypothetical protein
VSEAKVTGPGPLDMKLLAARLREADPALKRELRRNFKAAAEPVAGDVEQSILLMPSRHDGTLRAGIARTVTVSTSFTSSGVAVRVSSLGSRMPPGKESLPFHADSARGWRHPVFGHWDRTKGRQYGKPEWFERPVADNAREFAAAAQRSVDEIQRKLGAG